ncbi:uncharacterized protein [Parasteatoda tepidariorum]|uniref:uncharacterized protein n=1 Tax=Parasteatoda tepidariorum TaxID=114398 RepID=UPI00077FB4D3|nr:uncharacterized protein LOC107455301 [Parasteatoda tepidariorum]
MSRAIRCTQIEAPPPADRINPVTPFFTAGKDFAGPVHVRTLNPSDAAYIVLFTCATTRDIHLELVSDLSTDKFLLALQRFVGRRGLPHTIYSDNAATFHAANKELILLMNTLTSTKVQQFYAHNGIIWKFIVPRAAWWGGIEAALTSRPIVYEEGDEDNTEALTPAHFLTGRKLTSIPTNPNNNPRLTKLFKQQQDV